ncbi:ATP-binding protein [Exiguobacterium acetylicum]|uniref:sensor histidine kinase n=1 Tax=Exiguobacterium acetylicum TaxID=41170 RepID=UPI003977AEA7
MHRISYSVGGIVLAAFLICGSVLFGTLYYQLSQTRTQEVVDGLLNRGNTHRDVLVDSYDQTTMRHVSMMEADSSFTVVITDACGKQLEASRPLSNEMKSVLEHTDFDYRQQGKIVTMRDFLMTDSPITINGVHRGHVFMFASKTIVDHVLDPLKQQFFQVSLLALLLAGAASIWTTRLISRPLIQMEEATARLLDGEGGELPIDRQDELGQLARSIQQLKQDLDFLNRERSEFLASVSHELRTPLTYIKGYADILERQTLSPDEQQRYITIIREESQQMNEWIEQLFWLARIDANAFTMERKPIDIEELIHQVIRLVRKDIEQENVSLEIEGERLQVMGDAQQLRQMIMNIIENARRHTSSGKIIVRYGVNEAGAFIQIEDTGEGIAAESLPHVTKRLYRTEASRSRKHGGTGIGLSIVEAIAQAHGAELIIKSQLGQGTQVTLQWKEQ